MNWSKRGAWRALAGISGLLFTFLLASIPLWAAEVAEPDPADTPTGTIFRWLNFIIVFGGVGFLIAKHGGAFFRTNAQAIAASIHEATAAKAAADAELREVETKIARLDQEVNDLRGSARRDSTMEAERLRASGASEIEKIKQAARGELHAAERAAQQQLLALAASMAVERAGSVVKSRMNPEIGSRMLHDFVARLDRSKN